MDVSVLNQIAEGTSVVAGNGVAEAQRSGEMVRALSMRFAQSFSGWTRVNFYAHHLSGKRVETKEVIAMIKEIWLSCSDRNRPTNC